MEMNDAAKNMGSILVDGVNFAHIVTGVNAGLFDGIAKYGESGVSPATLAQENDYFEDYVRIWCESAYSMRILDYVGDGRFRLAEEYGKLLTRGTPESLINRIGIFELFAKERFEFYEFMRTGAVRTWEDHGDQLSKLAAAVAATMAGTIVDCVYKQLQEVEQKLRDGARVLEVGCGAGSTLMVLAREFPASIFVGTDVDGHALAMGESELASSDLKDRIHFRKLSADKLDYAEEFDLVTMAYVMHELRTELRTDAVHKIWRALRADGLLMSLDFLYPSDITDFRKPEYIIQIMDQAADCIWGARHLTRDQVADLLATCGFQRSEFHPIQYPNDQIARIVALAFK